MKLTSKQQIRVDIISKYINGEIFPEDASAALEVTQRQFRRLVRSFRENGIQSVLHGNKSRVPANKVSYSLSDKIVSLYREKYSGFNLVHFIEKLHENEAWQLPRVPCYTTIRNIFIREKIISVKSTRKGRIHRRRKAYEKEGIMVQIDGSPHHWLLGQSPCCLTTAIDDATGKLLGAKFSRTETTFAAMDTVERALKKYGRFQMLYSDRAGIYGGGKRDGYSNMNRAMKELGITPLQASTPQAKGKVERLFGTLQSRLASELKLRRIYTIEEANKFLEETYIEKFNAQFAKPTMTQEKAYRPLPQEVDLNELFTMREERVVKNGQTINYHSDSYVVYGPSGESLFKRRVEIRNYRNGEMRMFLPSGEEISFELLEDVRRAA